MNTLSISTFILVTLATFITSLHIGALQEPLLQLMVDHIPGNSQINSCSTPEEDLVSITRIDLTPSTPQRGQNLTIEAEGEVLEEIEEGAYVILNIKWGVITVYNKRVDFCEQLKHVNETCPLKKGAMKINKDIAIPQEVPPGTFNVHADVFTKDDKRITCLTAKASFPRIS